MGRKRKSLYDIAMNTGMRPYIEWWKESYNIPTVSDKAVLEETVWRKWVFCDDRAFVADCNYIIKTAKRRGLVHDPDCYLGATLRLITGWDI